MTFIRPDLFRILFAGVAGAATVFAGENGERLISPRPSPAEEMHLTLATPVSASKVNGEDGVNGIGSPKVVSPPTRPENGWQFTLAVPALLPSFNGEVGLQGVSSDINVPADKVLRNLDMAVFFRGEVSKGRVGFMVDFISMNLSGSVERSGLVQSMDVHFDETIGEPALRWRIVEKPRGRLDVYAGVRYLNVYQSLTFHPNTEQIQETSAALVDAVGNRLRNGISEGGLRDLIGQIVGGRLGALGDPTTLPAAPIGGATLPGAIRDQIQELIAARKAELSAAIQAGAQQRVDAIKQELSQSIAQSLNSKLNTSVSRLDDWWDPFIGLRGRLNLSPSWYLTGRGDIGGFGVGSQTAWQAEAALGCRITRNIFAEAGYRALDMNYESNGFKYDVIAHGPQLTIGVTF